MADPRSCAGSLRSLRSPGPPASSRFERRADLTRAAERRRLQLRFTAEGAMEVRRPSHKLQYRAPAGGTMGAPCNVGDCVIISLSSERYMLWFNFSELSHGRP